MPDEFSGRGIVIKDAKNITIKNAKIRGFKIAIYAENCPGLTIENCDVSNNYRQHLKSTPQKEDESDWLYGHENDKNEWLRYGAGIYLYKCEGATIKNCRARDGQNGICLVNCDNAKVIGNDMSFMSGWGLAMWRSCRCQVIGNRFDYCIRGYSHGVYARGQDSTGILVYEQCSDNVFAYNHATHGGDGFFLYAGNETVSKSGEGGCNRNLLYMNDFSYAVANGIEATFSDRNLFVNNKLSSCEHGIWGGYSSRSFIAGNEIKHCRNGISIEHGRGNRIARNSLVACKRGIWLWWDDDKDLLKSPYAIKQGAGSKDEIVDFNVLNECEEGCHLAGTKDVIVSFNRLNSCKCAFVADKDSTLSGFDCNSFVRCHSIENRTPNTIDGSDVKQIETVSGSFSNRGRGDFICGDGMQWGAPLVLPGKGSKWTIPIPDLPLAPILLDREPLGPLPNISDGKDHVVIDEWGPKIKP